MNAFPAVRQADGCDVLSRSRRLRAVLSLTEGGLTELVFQVWHHARLGELYPELLFANYGITMTTTPAMLLAAERCREVGDPVCEELRAYYLKHAEEERGHERWLLADLESLGISRERVLRRLTYPGVAALAGAQYYWIRHVHPAAYLGYLAAIEVPPSAEFLREVRERTGIPATSMSGHLRHAEIDIGHMAELDAVLDTLPLSQDQEELIAVSAISTVGHLESLFTDLLKQFERISTPALHSTLFTASAMAATATHV